MSDPYIVPITKVHSSFDEAKEFFDKFSSMVLFEDEERLAVGDLAQGKRNLIVGEPGIGKTLLLRKIKSHLEEGGFTAELVNLRQTDAIDQIDQFLDRKVDASKALLFDALDEVRSSSFPAVLRKIEEVSQKYPDLPIYLSSRWVFIIRYVNSFPAYRFITISPFTQGQVREYLLAAGHPEADIDALLYRVMSFGHHTLIIQIPRYLYYLEDFLSKKGLLDAKEVSRNDLFEYFIYSKLDLEQKKINADTRAIIKRVLEKLALTMEIYQTNVISKDELMTFFDDLKSDLKLVALSQISLDTFFDCSLLKNNIDSVEFENTEFQEYLAAKEITRFSNPGKAAFQFAVDPDAQEIYPTWFNALTFLVDMKKELLEQLVEFSGMRGVGFKVVDEGFLNFLGRIRPQDLSDSLKRRLFADIITYHTKTKQWLPGQLTSALSIFFSPLSEGDMKAWVDEAEKESDTDRYVPLANMAYAIGYLFQQKFRLDNAYWRNKLLQWTADKNENGVLQRHALFALEQLNDPTVVDELPNLMGTDELIEREFLSVCTALAPDDPKSLEYFFEAVRKNNFYGRYGLLEAKRSVSIKKFLHVFNEDVNFRREFLDDTRIFREKDKGFVDNIKAVFDNEIAELCKEALILAVHYNMAHMTEHSVFVMGLWKLLKEKNPSGFVPEMVDRINKSEGGKTGLYFAQGFFADTIQGVEDVPPYINAMIAIGERNSAFSVMAQIKFSKKPLSEEIFEAGRTLLPQEYKEWEEERVRPRRDFEGERKEEALKKFRIHLEPEPGKYSNNIFEYYLGSKNYLDPLSEDDRNRLIELLTGTVFKFIDPIKHELVITEEHDGSKTYRTSANIHIFGDALKVAKHLGLNVDQFRQSILNYIPFAYHEHLKIIFEYVKNIKPNEMAAVLEVYEKRQSDLWRHQTTSFIDAVEQYHIVEAAPVLQSFVKEEKCDKYSRERAIGVADSLAPDPKFLQDIFDLYEKSRNADEVKLAHIANGLLITNHADSAAIQWRLKTIIDRAAAFVQPKGVHNVGGLEEEIGHSKTFAKPLMELKQPSHEKDYLALLDEAMKIYARGSEFYAYANYLWDIVYAYFDNMKEGGSYAPLRILEHKISEIKDKDGANWFASRIVTLRRSYLGYLGKPRNISEAVKKYNEAREADDRKILNSADLFQHLQDALDTDLRKWIEGEGAYDVIVGPKIKDRRNEYEKLVQKTLKAQIENMLLRRGFQVEVLREPQLYDEKRVDMLVRYGFAGPVIIEVKLTSNSDIKGKKIEESASYDSMTRYMSGFGASHGIFLVINNTNAKNLPFVKEVFQKIPHVVVQSFDCFKSPTVAKRAKQIPPARSRARTGQHRVAKNVTPRNPKKV